MMNMKLLLVAYETANAKHAVQLKMVSNTLSQPAQQLLTLILRNVLSAVLERLLQQLALV